LPESAKEWIASASMALEPVKIAAAVLRRRWRGSRPSA
jgi:hypothetical protein